MAQTFTLSTVTNAIVVPPPPRIPRLRQLQLAVVDADHNAVPGTICGTNRLTSAGFQPSDTQLEKPEILPGTWLFGGLASHHFGHQITRSLGRLAALPHAGPIDGILFAPLDQRARDAAAINLLTRLLAGLGITAPIRVITEPTQVNRLIIGPDLFSEANDCRADPAYALWARGRFLPKGAAPLPGSKLYVTRSKLDPTLGRLLNEDILEQNLSRHGYQIYVPETQSLPDQLRTYAMAETIITTDGSHGHIMAFARQSGQQIITIARRFDAPKSLLTHLESFGHGLTNSSHTYLTCLAREWWPQQRTDNLSLGECDFAALLQTLIRAGALPPDAATNWQIPNQAQINASKALGRPDTDRLLSTDERTDFLRALRQARKPKAAAGLASAASTVPITTKAEPPMDSALKDKPATLHRAEGLRYFRVLKGLHQRLKPEWYLEIGTFTGSSLRLAEGNFVAIDPKFQLQHEAPLKGRQMVFFQDTSDAFFKSGTARSLKGKINLAFLDGLHHYEALLRDFINIEPLMAPGGMVILHDCLPYTVPMADRIQPPNTEWTGDVWKTLLILQVTRPDLQIDILDAAPTGLVVIRNMGSVPKSQMKSRYKSLLRTWDPVTFENRPGGLPAFWDGLKVLPAGPFLDGLPQA